MSVAKISLPKSVNRGESVAVRVAIQHPMETGYRVGLGGEIIPRDIIQTFTCSYNGVEIYRADFSPAIAANPLLTFHTVAVATGTLDFRWTGDNDFELVQTASITVV